MGNKGIGIIILVVAGIGAAFYFLKGKIKRRAVNEEVYVERKGIAKTVKSALIGEVNKKDVAAVKKGVVFTTKEMRSLPKSERPWRKAGMTHRAWGLQQDKLRREAGIEAYKSPERKSRIRKSKERRARKAGMEYEAWCRMTGSKI